MGNASNKIDEYFKQSLENYEMEADQSAWSKVKAKLAVRSFFVFNPYKVNIYYLIPVIAASLVFSLFIPDKYDSIIHKEGDQTFVYQESEANELKSKNQQEVVEIVRTVYTSEQVMIEREETVKISIAPTELAPFASVKNFQKSTITSPESAPSQIVEDEPNEVLDKGDKVVEDKIESRTKRWKYRKRRKPIKMH